MNKISTNIYLYIYVTKGFVLLKPNIFFSKTWSFTTSTKVLKGIKKDDLQEFLIIHL
jgi:hypothetical protein